MTKINNAPDGIKGTLVGSEKVALTDSTANPGTPDPSTTIESIKDYANGFINEGESNLGANLGLGTQVYEGKSGVNLRFRTVDVLNNKLGISIVSDVITLQLNEGNIVFDNIPDTLNYVKITVAEQIIITNSVSSVLVSGAGANPVKSKTGNVLTLKSYQSSNSSITITENVDDLDLVGATVVNFGTGLSLIQGFSGKEVRLKSLESTDGSITIANNGNNIDLKANGTFGEVNTASNLGSGRTVFSSKLGVDLRFKSFQQQTGISITQDTDTIYIANTSIGEANTASNLGAGVGVFAQKNGDDLEFKSVNSQTGISVTQDTENLYIGNTGILGGQSLGTGSAVFKDVSSSNLRFRRIYSNAGDLTIVENTNDITFDLPNGIGEVNTASNVGVGSGVYRSKFGPDLRFRKLRSDNADLTITENDLDVKFDLPNGIGEDNAALNVGTGAGVYKQIFASTIELRKLRSSNSSITVTENTSDIDFVLNGSLGEVNTASNVGTGIAVFKQKTGVNFEFKRLRSSEDTMDVVSETSSIDINSKQKNSNATTFPTSGDDTGDNYDYGSKIIDTVNDNIWVCVDPGSGAADWFLTRSFDTKSVTTSLDCRSGLMRKLTMSSDVTCSVINWRDGYEGKLIVTTDGSSRTLTLHLDGATTNVKGVLGFNNPLVLASSSKYIIEFFFMDSIMFYKHYTKSYT